MVEESMLERIKRRGQDGPFNRPQNISLINLRRWLRRLLKRKVGD
jgi:hypothetical protein